MSGRARHWRDGELITNRKTDRRQSVNRPPHEMPDWVLTFRLPGDFAFSVTAGAPTGVIGVIVKPGAIVEARGKQWEWVYRQAAAYLGTIARGRDLVVTATVTRDAAPAAAPSAPASPAIKGTQAIIAVSRPSIVFPRALKEPLIFPVR